MWWLDLVLGLSFAFAVSVIVILFVAGCDRQTRRHIRSLRERERLQRQEDRCVMEGVGGGRVCRTCGKHADAHLNGVYHIVDGEGSDRE